MGKMVPGLLTIIQIVESEFGINDMKAWIYPALSQWLRLLVVMQ